MSDRAPQARTGSPEAASGQLRSFGVFIDLEKRARHAKDEAELQFLMVNETLELARYRQALLWRRSPSGATRIAAVSGLSAVDRNTPFIAWAERLCAALQRGEQVGARPVETGDLPEQLAGAWAEWLPAHALWIPLTDRDGTSLGALLLARDQPWTEGERHLLSYLTDAYGHAWAALLRQVSRRARLVTTPRRRLWLALFAILIACGLIPVRQSALAPAEVVPRDPVVIRAPIDGVVDHFQVEPNQSVSKGQPLLRLDDTRLISQLEVARMAQQVTEAELRQASQQAFFDERSKASLALIKGRLEQHAEEVAYVEGLLDRVEIRAPRGGLAIFDNVNDWTGRPVAMGERILLVANPDAVELEISLPVADAIALERGADVQLFLNIAPQAPVPASLHYASYQAHLTPTSVLAYRLLARFEPQQQPLRIGLKGTAKVYGQRTILAVHLLRRPFAALRQFLGW
ncbi:MAG: hypothetical protein C0614_06955 [Desulfuromonas sp.]|nr:MAG: hypothetical protein C0614_06955 [Desulfuromonas sp.]